MVVAGRFQPYFYVLQGICHRSNLFVQVIKPMLIPGWILCFCERKTVIQAERGLQNILTTFCSFHTFFREVLL